MNRNREAIRALVLGQKLLQLTLPGVPDTLPGHASWWTSRWSTPTTAGRWTSRRARSGWRPCVARGPADLDDEKLQVTVAALRVRREHGDAFGDRGGHTPITAESRHLVGFLRGDDVAVLATRAPQRLEAMGGWGETTVRLPDGLWRDELTADAHRRRRVRRGRPPGGLPGRPPPTGAHDMTREMSVWAPHAGAVDLLLGDARLPMSRADDGWWHVTCDVDPAASYAFSIDGGDPRPDPRGLRLPDGPHGWSQLYDPAAFTWSDDGWTGRPLDGAVLYELHVGTFTPAGTLDAAAERLEHLVDLGVDVVELLPLAPFPGERGWGYDGVAPYAVHETYGGPAALQRFVDEAHRRGLAVCLDVVYNHLGPDGNYLAEFGPYLTAKHTTPWGEALNLDDRDSDPVRQWVLDNVVQWLRDFHVDGLRLDAVHELHDDRAEHILEEMSATVDALAARTGRSLWLIAESDRNDPGTVTPRGRGDAVGGVGLHGQWSDDVHHALHVALSRETQGYYRDFADPDALAKVLRTPFFHDGTWSSFRGRRHGRPVDPTLPGWRFVASLQTHDQVGNRATGDRLSALVGPDVLACGAAILLTSPWTPMLFMGEEWAASTPWQYFTDHTDPALAEAVREGRRAEFAAHGWAEGDVPDPQDPATFTRSKLDWEEPSHEPHARMLRWYRDLIALRHDCADLRDPRMDLVRVEWDPATGRFRMQRGEHLVLVNLGAEPLTFAAGGSVLLSWEDGVKAEDGHVEVPAGCAVVVGP